MTKINSDHIFVIILYNIYSYNINYGNYYSQVNPNE